MIASGLRAAAFAFAFFGLLVAPTAHAASADIEIAFSGIAGQYFLSPGETLPAHVVVENLGTSSATVTLSPVGLPSGWAFSGGPVTVPAGGSVTTTVTVTPSTSADTANIQVLATTAGDSDATPGALDIVVPVLVDLTLDFARYTITEDVSGFVVATYLDGAPAAGKALLVWNDPQFLVFRNATVTGSIPADGTFRFSFPADPLGASSPGHHVVTASVTHGGSAPHDRADYDVLL